MPINMSVMRYRKVGSEIQSNLLKISREGNYSFQGPIKSTITTEFKTWYINNSNGKEVATFLISGKRVQTTNILISWVPVMKFRVQIEIQIQTEYNIINLNIIIL